MGRAIPLALTAALLVATPWANAKLVAYTMNGIFNDGGTATGTFVVDTTKLDPTSSHNSFRRFRYQNDTGNARCHWSGIQQRRARCRSHVLL